jgi:flagellar basal-body rod protein FlgG
MNRAMYVAASGMAAEQSELDTITENLSNADVTAFKGAIAHVRAFGAGDDAAGVAVDGQRRLFTQGKLVASGGPFDIALRGEGFFAVQRGKEVAYTRDGSFTRNAEGQFINGAGWHLAGLRAEANARSLSVSPDGRVSAKTAHGESVIGRLRIAVFPSPERLRVLQPTLFAETCASGGALFLAPNPERGPSIAFGMLERSNVSIVESMMEIMKAQRAYEADAKGVQAADDMTRIANNLERGA